MGLYWGRLKVISSDSTDIFCWIRIWLSLSLAGLPYGTKINLYCQYKFGGDNMVNARLNTTVCTQVIFKKRGNWKENRLYGSWHLSHFHKNSKSCNKYLYVSVRYSFGYFNQNQVSEEVVAFFQRYKAKHKSPNDLINRVICSFCFIEGSFSLRKNKTHYSFIFIFISTSLYHF